MSAQHRPVIIAGAGVGGLSAALALGRKGFNVRVLEQAQAIQAIGYGIQLGPNAFHVLKRLGIAERVLDFCSFPQAGIMRDVVSGAEITRLPMGAALRERYGQPYAVIHRGDLHQALLDACAACGRIELVTAARVTAFEDRADHVVVSTANADYEAHALIGADGVWSTVRAQLFDTPVQPRSLGFFAYRGLVERHEIPDELFECNVNLWAGPGFHMMHYPLRADRLFNIVAVFRSTRFAQGDADCGGPDELHRIFGGACDHVARLLQLVPTDKHWEISTMDPLPQWTRGRVALLGDSAHAMLQALAQGACQAMEDGICLAEQMAAQPRDCEAALTAYQRQRQTRAVRAQYESRLYWEVYHAHGAYATLRNELLRRTPSQAIESLSWVYQAPDLSLQPH